MAYEIKMEKFSGPLDLLLQLIETEKLPVTEIALAEVTEQYLRHLDAMQDKDPEELADFLLVAARLLLIKSRALLPELGSEDEPDELEKQLKIYKEFLEASKKMAELLALDRRAFGRDRQPVKTEAVFTPPAGVTVEIMRSVFLAVLKKLDPLVKLPRQAIAKTVSLQEKIGTIRTLLSGGALNFRRLLGEAKSRTEVIVSFLAILELLKQRHLKVKQTENFQDIIIEQI